MRKINLLIVCFVLINLFSCTSDLNYIKNIENTQIEKIKLTEDEYLSIAYENPKNVSVEEAINVIKNNNLFPNIKTRNQSSKIYFIKLSNKYLLNNENDLVKVEASTRLLDNNTDNILIYEFLLGDLNDTTKVIFCADERVNKILAYIEKYQSCHDDGQFDDIFKLSTTYAISNINRIKNLQDSLREPTFNKIGKQLNISKENLYFKNIKNNIQIIQTGSTRSNMVDEPPTEPITGVFPLLESKWGQYDPYNCKLPGYWNWWLQPDCVPAGCNTSVLAQLFAYHRINLTYEGITMDWDYLLENESIRGGGIPGVICIGNGEPIPSDPQKKLDMIGALYKYIFYQLKSETIKKYRIYGEPWAAVTDTRVKLTDFNTLLNKTFRNKSHNSWRFDLVKESLNKYLSPVILYTTEGSYIRNTCIVDGYLICKPKTEGRSDDYYIHIQFNYEHGYFLMDKNYNLDIEKPNVNIYNNNIKVKYDIFKSRGR